ncbi:hypothetical protein DESC_610056 [Desulfosarcina cetonica]|nr:hypothetical protein DESC_610056 [Desulfosarcina cetonica]
MFGPVKAIKPSIRICDWRLGSIGYRCDFSSEKNSLTFTLPADTIIEKATAFNPDVIGVSGLLALAFDSMRGLGRN